MQILLGSHDYNRRGAGMFKFIALAKRCPKPLTLTAVVAASALGFAAQPALASQSQGNGPFQCRVFASEPKVSVDGTRIFGHGSSICTGTGYQDQKIVVTLEEHPFPTLYRVLAQASTDYRASREVHQKVSWSCTLSGTHTYTIETSWYGQDGALYGAINSPDVSLTCSG
jgi:hypothetical protein